MSKEIVPWELISSSMALDERWCKVRRDTVRLPDGTVLDDYFVAVRPDVAITFALTEDGRVPLVEQYKHGAGEVTLELPAGTFVSGRETPEEAGERELLEEVGVKATSTHVVATLFDDATKNNNRVYCMVGLDAEEGFGQALDDTESAAGVNIKWVTVAEFQTMLATGVVRAQSSVACGYAALAWLAAR